jgi:hypothetical protein
MLFFKKIFKIITFAKYNNILFDYDSIYNVAKNM